MWKFLSFVLLIAIVIGIILHFLYPRIKEIEKVIPVIETRYDTVSVTPKWLADSVKKWKKKVHTTDTVNIYESNTIIDTFYINVGTRDSARTKIWPVFTYRSGANFGDSALIGTFNLQDGKGSISKFFVPGILVGITADSNSMPRLDFEPFPKPKKISLLEKLKYIGGGFAMCQVVNMVKIN